MFQRILAVVFIICLLLSLSGCKSKKKTDLSAASDIPVASESLAQETMTELSALDRTLLAWGQGKVVDENNVPVSCNDYNAKYGKYDARFGGNVTLGKIVYLTFDQGYENGYTTHILDTLKEKNCPAVFFVTMDYVKSEPELIRRMIDEGHIIGNHSVSHPCMPTLSIEEAKAEITELHDYLWKEYSYQMVYFRPPKGEFSEQTLALAQQLGYTHVFWSFAYRDWVVDDQPQAGTALNKLLDGAHDGAIYLLHAVSSTNTAILGDFIDGLRQKGYTFSVEI